MDAEKHHDEPKATQAPSLDMSREHHHPPVHHGDGADKEGIAYTKSLVPDAAAFPSGKMGEKDGVTDISDPERGSTSPVNTVPSEEHQRGYVSRFYHRYRLFVHIFIWLFFTGWWIASLILHRHDKNWIIPFLLYLAITLRIIFLHVPISVIMRPARWVWGNTAVRFAALIPEKFRMPAFALLTIAVIVVGTFASPTSRDNTLENRGISLLGLVVFIFLLWATSRNRKLIKWHTVIMGMLMQFIIALFVLRTTAGYDIFNFISTLARELLGFADDGTAFLTSDDVVSTYSWFLITTLPAVIFFVSLVQILYYIGLVQWLVGKFASFFFWSMRISGAEAVVAAASPFIGQGESAMLIKPFVAHLTMGEIHQVMCSGFATIAGSVLVSYIAMGVNPQALVSSCVMSIPASIAMSKLRWPEEEETLTNGRVVIPEDDTNKAANALQAFANGAWLGLKIAGMIMCNLLCIIALIALIDGLLTWWGRYINLHGDYDLTLELILGYIFYPVAFLLGVDRDGDDILKVAKLIGIKIVANEYVAYSDLATGAEFANLSTRSRLIATYSLCGFGNIGSVGNQIGVLTQLSPTRSGDVSRVAISALLTGILATLSSASIAGLVIIDQAGFTTPSTA
ncbi:H+/nucleoside cotransporter-like protein [Phyllosticta citrichinensis]|uniref:H+/nucleoside cotransporter-like protein n=1 Tax=Phyllosticta citrichinensis TaxID=1130410 RepID=A0ABR1XZ03_9PEZI